MGCHAKVMREVYLKTYIGILSVLALSLAASWVYWYGVVVEPRWIAGALVFAGVILLGEAFPIRVSSRGTIGVWDIGLVIAIATVGPTWATVAALPAAVFAGRHSLLRAAFEVGQTVVMVHLAGLIFSFASAPLFAGTAASTPTIVYGTIATGLTLMAANKTIVLGLIQVKYGRGIHGAFKEEVEPYLASDALNVLTAGLGVLVLAAYGPAAALVVLVGAIGSQALAYRSRDKARENAELRQKVTSLEEALSVSNLTFGTMIVDELGRGDGFTDRHAAATAVYAADIGREMGLDETQVGRLRTAGLLHNVGLFGLPEDLLTATGKLNSIAQSRLAEHPARGEKALAAIPEFGEMALWVRWHHERPDGRGYPDKLRGPWIPAEAKILAVAQAYADLVLDGPSRPGVGPAEARERLCAGVETEFDGGSVRAFLRILDTESEGYRMADDHRFVFPVASERRATTDPESGRDAARNLSAEQG